MVLNHVDNSTLFCHIIDRASCKPLLDKMHECFHLLQQIGDKDVSGKLYLALTDAVELAENNAFDKGTQVQAAITTDELTAHEDEEEAPSKNSASGDDVPDTKAHVEAARAFVEGLTAEQLTEFGHDDFSGRDQMADALDTIEKLAELDNATAWNCYTAFMESNLSGVHFVIDG